jgi:hypothetical protein
VVSTGDEDFRDSPHGDSMFGTLIKGTKSVSGSLTQSTIVRREGREAREGLAPIVMVVQGNNEERRHNRESVSVQVQEFEETSITYEEKDK